MNDENAIKLENICKAFKVKRTSPHNKRQPTTDVPNEKYHKNIILDKISLNIKKGETVGIIGRNGSGKSTLLKIVSNILEPDSGTVKINGKTASILELGMGFHQDLSGRENIYIKGSMYGFSKKEIDEKIERIIDYAGLGEQIDDPIRTYSSGMSGRLAFAIMINVDAEILIIDEILSVGDASFSAKASQHFKHAAKSGKTILFVSHSIGTVSEMCSRTIWIENGKIKEDGETKIVCDHYKEEIKESFEITKEFAEAGVVDAQYRLAHMYFDGNKVELDYAEACKWMEIAAENNNVDAIVEYGDMLFEGIGTTQDIQQAIVCYQKAADLGNNEAAIKVATLMNNNTDRQMLLDMFKQLAERGFPSNEFYFAEILLKTSIDRKGKEEAFKWFEKAAEKGHLDSKYRIAMMYGRGLGVKKDIEKHIVLLEEVAGLGHTKAQHDLAEIFYKGILVKKDEKRSFGWYLRSAESGNPKSQYQVAIMYRDGIGINTCLENAKKWFEIFSNSFLIKYWSMAGDVLRSVEFDTELTSDGIYKKMAETFDLRSMLKVGRMSEDVNSTIKWLQMAADRQNTTAQVLLGDIYFNGKGVEIDYARAFEYYSKAAIAGSPVASRNLATMYKNGIFVDRDINKYEEYTDYASENRYRFKQRY